jgi:hypothetical protein
VGRRVRLLKIVLVIAHFSLSLSSTGWLWASPHFSGRSLRASRNALGPCINFRLKREARVVHAGGFCSLIAQCTSWIGGSIGDMGRKGKTTEMWLGTRSKRANLLATHRERRLLLTCRDNRRRTRLQLRLAQGELKLQATLQSKQTGSSAAPHCLQCEG